MRLSSLLGGIVLGLILSSCTGAVGIDPSSAVQHTSATIRPHIPPTVVGFFPDPVLQGTVGGGWLLYSNGKVLSIPESLDATNPWLCNPATTACSYYGDLPSKGINVNDIVSMLPAPDGSGYYILGRNGSVYGFNVPYRGSIPAVDPGFQYPAVGMSLCGNDQGYYVIIDPTSASTKMYFVFGSGC